MSKSSKIQNVMPFERNTEDGYDNDEDEILTMPFCLDSYLLQIRTVLTDGRETLSAPPVRTTKWLCLVGNIGFRCSTVENTEKVLCKAFIHAYMHTDEVINPDFQ